MKDGTIEVQLWLTDDSSAVLEQLKALGFTTSETRPKEKVIVGHMPVEKLTDLAKISAVRFVSPVMKPISSAEPRTHGEKQTGSSGLGYKWFPR